MAWPEKLKLNKQLIRSVNEAGYSNPKEIQQKMLPRIFGGQDVIGIGVEGCGKTTTYVLSVLNRLKHSTEGVPLVLILVPSKEHVLAVIEQFESLNKNKSVLIVGLHAAPGIETQMNALADGADVVVATPDRARSIYLKLGLNLNKVELLIIDDADSIVKQGLQLPVAELANSITKCQHLVFTEVMHDKLNKMIDPFMVNPSIIEVNEVSEGTTRLYPQMLYHVPDFAAKLNLLSLFMLDDELFNKVVLFVNTNHTAGKVFRHLQNGLKNGVSLLNPDDFGGSEDFKTSVTARALIVSTENNPLINLENIPILLHFELPPDKETYIRHLTNPVPDADNEILAITFATDLELSMVKKIEHTTGQKLTSAELPEGIVIEKSKRGLATEKKSVSRKNKEVKVTGEAFHEKKASNSKTYNYGSGVKAKMNNKKKHS